MTSLGSQPAVAGSSGLPAPPGIARDTATASAAERQPRSRSPVTRKTGGGEDGLSLCTHLSFCLQKGRRCRGRGGGGTHPLTSGFPSKGPHGTPSEPHISCLQHSTEHVFSTTNPSHMSGSLSVHISQSVSRKGEDAGAGGGGGKGGGGPTLSQVVFLLKAHTEPPASHVFPALSTALSMCSPLQTPTCLALSLSTSVTGLQKGRRGGGPTLSQVVFLLKAHVEPPPSHVFPALSTALSMCSPLQTPVTCLSLSTSVTVSAEREKMPGQEVGGGWGGGPTLSQMVFLLKAHMEPPPSHVFPAFSTARSMCSPEREKMPGQGARGGRGDPPSHKWFSF